MFKHLPDLPPEIAKMIIDRMDVKSQLIVAGCSFSSFYQTFDSIDFISSITVEPISQSLRTQYKIHLGVNLDIGCCIEVTKKSEMASDVEYYLESMRRIRCWKVLMDGPYENVTTDFLKLLFKKNKITLKHVEIMPIEKSSQQKQQKELSFDSFNIRSLKNLRTIHISSKDRDLLKCGFTTMEQLRYATKSIRLTNTKIPIDELRGTDIIEIDQLDFLTDFDVLEYLRFLKNTTSPTARGMKINLVGDTESNHINIGIKQRIEQVFEHSFPIYRNISNKDGFEIVTRNHNNSIIIHFNVGKRITIFCG